jgi:hypothetical protein
MRPHLRFAIGLKVCAEVSRETVLDSSAEPKSRAESDVGVHRPGILRSGLADSDAVLMSSAIRARIVGLSDDETGRVAIGPSGLQIALRTESGRISGDA